MGHPKEDEVLPIDSVVRITRGFHNTKFAIIRDHARFKGGKFQHYLGQIEGLPEHQRFVLYHDEIEIEALPKKDL